MSTQTEVVLDYTALSAAARCGRLYQLQYEDGWQPRETNVPMFAGTCMHSALEVLYTVAWDRKLAQEALAASWGDFRTPPNHRHGYLTLGHLQIVLENYMDDRETHPTALEDGISEHAMRFGEQALVFDWRNAAGETLRIGGKLDLPTHVGASLAIADHKCSTQWITEFWARERFALGHQLRIYKAAMLALTGEPFESAYINGIYIGKGAADGPEAWKRRSSAPNRLFGPYDFTPAQLEETWQWAKGWQETISFWRERQNWPQNEKACGDFGGCAMLPVCTANPTRRGSELARGFERWTPQGVLASGADGKVPEKERAA